MLGELMKVRTFEEMEGVAVRLLNADAFRILQEDMVKEDVAFLRVDYWPEDVLARKAQSIASMKQTLREIEKEPAERKVLHVLQLITVIAPGTVNGINRFLRRVTFG